ncbi:uncharacterized protein [Notamacropus eugenii]|uniref:uncharacterized protein n=1 Tax=Notamacropus eugenii TaxID=9315 RepID=UPI003B685AFC
MPPPTSAQVGGSRFRPQAWRVPRGTQRGKRVAVPASGRRHSGWISILIHEPPQGVCTAAQKWSREPGVGGQEQGAGSLESRPPRSASRDLGPRAGSAGAPLPLQSSTGNMDHGPGPFSFRLLPLLLLVLLTMVIRKSESVLLSKQNYRASGESCDSLKEYRHEELCCLSCPRGTHVVKNCTISHTLGDCRHCPRGKYVPENGQICRPCAGCRGDQEMLIPCYNYMNTKCQCKEGYYCKTEDYKVCQPCTKRCPEGTPVLQRCTATADIVCGVPGTGITSTAESSTVRGSIPDWLWILILLVFNSLWWDLVGSWITEHRKRNDSLLVLVWTHMTTHSPGVLQNPS